MRERVTGVIIKDQKILLFKRVKPETEYFIFPGGGVDPGETFEETLKREVREELTLDVIKYKFLFSLENIVIPQVATIHAGARNEHFFQVLEYSGVPEIGGPEKESMNEQNQYHIVWLNFKELQNMSNVCPKEGVLKLLEFFEADKIKRG